MNMMSRVALTLLSLSAVPALAREGPVDVTQYNHAVRNQATTVQQSAPKASEYRSF